MILSLFTPTHDPRWLPETWESIKGQAFDEWVIFEDDGCQVAPWNDSRVRVERAKGAFNRPAVKGVGLLKSWAANECTGDILVELDHDDLLAPGAIEEIKAAFADPAVQFVYSNHVEFADGFTNPPNYPYSPAYGWTSRPAMWNGRNGLFEMVAFQPSPHSFRRILWAPNHVRAWRRSAYVDLGGHNPELPVADDHDLCARTYIRYGAAGCRHINRPLYMQRIHAANTQKVQNGEVQRQANLSYLRHIEALAQRWARDNHLRLIDLGGRLNAPSGFTTVDLIDADIRCDLTKPWPIAADSVGVLRASHTLEHLPDPIHAMNEAYRVLAPGGFFFIEVPSATGKGAFRDPTHKSFWVDESFLYYTNADLARFIRPQFTGRFQASRVEEYVRPGVGPVVAAELICLKDGYKPVGEVKI